MKTLLREEYHVLPLKDISSILSLHPNNLTYFNLYTIVYQYRSTVSDFEIVHGLEIKNISESQFILSKGICVINSNLVTITKDTLLKIPILLTDDDIVVSIIALTAKGEIVVTPNVVRNNSLIINTPYNNVLNKTAIVTDARLYSGGSFTSVDNIEINGAQYSIKRQDQTTGIGLSTNYIVEDRVLTASEYNNRRLVLRNNISDQMVESTRIVIIYPNNTRSPELIYSVDFNVLSSNTIVFNEDTATLLQPGINLKIFYYPGG